MKKIIFNYIDILNEQLEVRSAKNSSYSLRAFARDLELSPSRLSQILNKKKGLSEEAAVALAEKLGLSDREQSYFVLSAKSQHSRSLKVKAEATKDLKDIMSPKLKSMPINNREFELAHSWYHMAILELMELRDCEHSPEWFAKKLNIKKIIVKNALERLEKIGWIKLQNGSYCANFEANESPNDLPSDAIKKFHDDMLKKAEAALFTDDINHREFQNMTLAFSLAQMQEAKEAIRSFQKEFAKKFYPDTQERDSVYQLSVQLFRLDSNLTGELK